jgi:zinc-binding alcohol dehydrogenase/oxidoreductase
MKAVVLEAFGDEVYAMPFGQSSNGSYAEYLCLPVEFVAKKPNNLTFDQAAAVPLSAMTAYRAMIASSALKGGDTIFIAY